MKAPVDAGGVVDGTMDFLNMFNVLDDAFVRDYMGTCFLIICYAYRAVKRFLSIDPTLAPLFISGHPDRKRCRNLAYISRTSTGKRIGSHPDVGIPERAYGRPASRVFPKSMQIKAPNHRTVTMRKLWAHRQIALVISDTLFYNMFLYNLLYFNREAHGGTG